MGAGAGGCQAARHISARREVARILRAFAESRAGKRAPTGSWFYAEIVNGGEVLFKEPLWRHVLGDVLRRARLAQGRTLKDVADEARISMPYLSEIERGRKEASSEILAAAARSLGLSLSQLLVLAQEELVQATQVRVRVQSSLSLSVAAQRGDVRAGFRRQEMCLAA